MVLDPHLSKHLTHWGIDVQSLEKTEKSMAEMQIDLNLRHQFDRISQEVEPVSGPGFVGMANLGNSCYLNSVMQVIFGCIPELKLRFAKRCVNSLHFFLPKPDSSIIR